MNALLKLVYRTVRRVVNQARLLPQSVAMVLKQRRQQVMLKELEAERLDRIRNPSKYRGK